VPYPIAEKSGQAQTPAEFYAGKTCLYLFCVKMGKITKFAKNIFAKSSFLPFFYRSLCFFCLNITENA